MTGTRFQELISRNQARLSTRRKIVNAIMLSLTGVLTLIALVPLFWIVGYVLYKGGASLNLAFFTQLPRPLGMEGGGVLNAIEGTPSLLRPGYTMASIIANEFAEAVTTLHTEALIEIGLTLFFITLLLNIIARLLVWSVARRTTQEARA